MIAIVGPTGTGKSDLALRVAEAFRGEIVNCDSLQLYRYFDIGTAKLAVPERRGIPHHLLDVLDPDEIFSAGDYARHARRILGEIASRGALPVVVGGTGFYLRALVDGLFAGPERDEGLRERLVERERRRPGSLYRLLGRFDPGSLVRIHARDVHKTIRALEVSLAARRPMSQMFRAGREPLEGFRVLKVGLDPPRDALYQRLDARCRDMFEHGLVEEVQSILARGFPASAKPFESHGYRQALQLLRGELSPEQAIQSAQRNTRRYAKRQWTWFRKEPGLAWCGGFGAEQATQNAALALIHDFLKKISLP
ncbi:MAG: tRNA (adenosine(37)-N6)-dimethylallyltransferase MiaA [Acidobacteria bacterium]|nr:tRNA (adenosine(37)-N6)-dimethylallyltransferase MiaA [Acidobacteriota bacterium]